MQTKFWKFKLRDYPQFSAPTVAFTLATCPLRYLFSRSPANIRYSPEYLFLRKRNYSLFCAGLPEMRQTLPMRGNLQRIAGFPTLAPPMRYIL